MVHKIKTIGIIGAGRMGTGIAQVGLMHHFEVLIFDSSRKNLENGLKVIRAGLEKAVNKGTLTAKAKGEVLPRLKKALSLDQFKTSHFIIEAAAEDERAKKKIFSELDSLLPSSVILASNTSSIPITRLASATQRPDRVIGMHFMNPAPVMELVEVISGCHTSSATKQTTVHLAGQMGKKVVEANDSPGFIVNRILMPMINEAAFALMDRTGTAEAIDQAMKSGAHFPMGPLELADLIGLDICLDICEVLHKEFGDPKYRPCPILKKYVEAGWHGKKTGRGFYIYPKE
ncbi:MAG: 3-hydroxybutyryl-CoA dehydrogenase [Nitrospirae bacterium]|nr:3-hydroxybutyryl-CoA dehydrogenase [Nitrospirota bacterium]MBI3352436.1 3-hydroxybutyryl-CoA dehydrogenase [Nitrospirota bacterium]